MELKLSSNFSGKPVSVVVPIEKVIEAFWPKDEKPPISLTVSTVLGADSANAEFSLGEETKESYPGIWLTTDNVKSHRHGSWFRLELPNDTNDIVMGHLYAGDDDMELTSLLPSLLTVFVLTGMNRNASFGSMKM